ncbi:hypothetical protein XENORESO_016893 [Xenotaenia resolanae]|uniref:Uncharacterized protein n=1 Tax=Xenotaenia resolanae TaxID=208358 RepID=A0ABV0WRU0_9TELE
MLCSLTFHAFSHSFGYDSGRRSNLKLLDETTLMFIAGNLLVLLDVSTKQQRYLRSCSGGGIGALAVHLTREFFTVAEKGNHPIIVVYEYPLQFERLQVERNADSVELEAGGGDAELQGHLTGGLQSQLLPVRPGAAHLIRIGTHQVPCSY